MSEACIRLTPEHIHVCASVRNVPHDQVQASGLKVKEDSVRIGNQTCLFDKTFSCISTSPTTTHQSSQEALHTSIGKAVLNEAWQGKSAAIICLGTEKSGKSHSLFGPSQWDVANTPLEQQGLVPRIFNDIFHQKNLEKASSVETLVDVSLLEINGEDIRDMFDGHRCALVGSLDWGFWVDNLQRVPVDAFTDVQNALCSALATRQSRPTWSAASSHFIMEIHIRSCTAHRNQPGQTTLTPLATSRIIIAELAAFTSSDTMDPNLLSLDNCVQQIGACNTLDYQATFRSPLTRLLKDCIIGTYSTTWLATISPTQSDARCTANVLSFAKNLKKLRGGEGQAASTIYKRLGSKAYASTRSMQSSPRSMTSDGTSRRGASPYGSVSDRPGSSVASSTGETADENQSAKGPDTITCITENNPFPTEAASAWSENERKAANEEKKALEQQVTKLQDQLERERAVNSKAREQLVERLQRDFKQEIASIKAASTSPSSAATGPRGRHNSAASCTSNDSNWDDKGSSRAANHGGVDIALVTQHIEKVWRKRMDEAIKEKDDEKQVAQQLYHEEQARKDRTRHLMEHEHSKYKRTADTQRRQLQVDCERYQAEISQLNAQVKQNQKQITKLTQLLQAEREERELERKTREDKHSNELCAEKERISKEVSVVLKEVEELRNNGSKDSSDTKNNKQDGSKIQLYQRLWTAQRDALMQSHMDSLHAQEQRMTALQGSHQEELQNQKEAFERERKLMQEQHEMSLGHLQQTVALLQQRAQTERAEFEDAMSELEKRSSKELAEKVVEIDHIVNKHQNNRAQWQVKMQHLRDSIQAALTAQISTLPLSSSGTQSTTASKTRSESSGRSGHTHHGIPTTVPHTQQGHQVHQQQGHQQAHPQQGHRSSSVHTPVWSTPPSTPTQQPLPPQQQGQLSKPITTPNPSISSKNTFPTVQHWKPRNTSPPMSLNIQQHQYTKTRPLVRDWSPHSSMASSVLGTRSIQSATSTSSSRTGSPIIGPNRMSSSGSRTGSPIPGSARGGSGSGSGSGSRTGSPTSRGRSALASCMSLSASLITPMTSRSRSSTPTSYTRSRSVTPTRSITPTALGPPHPSAGGSGSGSVSTDRPRRTVSHPPPLAVPSILLNSQPSYSFRQDDNSSIRSDGSSTGTTPHPMYQYMTPNNPAGRNSPVTSLTSLPSHLTASSITGSISHTTTFITVPITTAIPMIPLVTCL